jgi:hypothetical protein
MRSCGFVVDHVEDAKASVATPGADYRRDVFAAQHGVQRIRSVGIFTGQITANVQRRARHVNFESEKFQSLQTRFETTFVGRRARWCDDSDPISWFD